MNDQISLYGVAYSLMRQLDRPLFDLVTREAERNDIAPIFYVADVLDEHYTPSWKWLRSEARLSMAGTIIIATIYENHHLLN